MTDPNIPQQPGVPPTPPAPGYGAPPPAPQQPYQAPPQQPAGYGAPPQQPGGYGAPPQQTPYGAAPGAPVAPAVPLTEAEDKQWASFAHFGGIIGFLPSLIIFLVFKDRGARTRVEAKEALNWQITWIAGSIILQILLAILGGILVAVLPWGASTAILGVFQIIGFLPWVANVIFSIMGGVKVNGGGSYRYPFAIRLIK